jgi:hypothetical protein
MAAIVALLACAAPVRADDGENGHFTVEVGTLIAEEAGALTPRALLRSEIAFRLIGPFAAGGFLQATIPDDPMASPPGFGGGLILALRPELPELGFVPHLEVTGARLQLPSRGQTLVDAWSIGIGAGVGAAITTSIALEARVHHQWWLGMSPSSELADHAWSAALAVTVDLP